VGILPSSVAFSNRLAMAPKSRLNARQAMLSKMKVMEPKQNELPHDTSHTKSASVAPSAADSEPASQLDSAPKEPPSPNGRLVVMGDWLIDEHWVTGTHRSDTASRTGDTHVRSIHSAFSHVMELGGTGTTSSLLFESNWSIWGIGLWHERDDAFIKNLFNPFRTRAVTPFCLASILQLAGENQDVPPLSPPPPLHDAETIKLLPGQAPEGAGKVPPRKLAENENTDRSNVVADIDARLKRDILLTNLAKSLEESEARVQLKKTKFGGTGESATELADFECVGTNRVIRIYRESDGKEQVLGRVDWQLPAPHMGEQRHPSEWITTEKTADRFKTLVSEHGQKRPKLECALRGVIIEDLAKGVMSKLSLTAMWNGLWKESPNSTEKVPVTAGSVPVIAGSVPVFAGSKVWSPGWLPGLLELSMDVALLQFHYSASRAAVRAGRVGEWIDKCNGITFEAMELLDELYEKTRAKLILFAVDEWRLVGRMLTSDGKAKTIVQTEKHPQGIKRDTGVGGPLLAALVHMYLSNDKSWSHDLVKKAFSFAVDRAVKNNERVTNPSGWTPTRDGFANPTKPREPRSVLGAWSEPRPWANVKAEWADSRRGIGVITQNTKRNTKEEEEEKEKEESGSPSRQVLQLWRSMTVLDGYVCLCPKRRGKILEILRGFRAWRDATPKHTRKPASIMLVAKPGSGKTHLINCLNNRLQFDLLEFNISQMVRRENLLDMFDEVVTRQARRASRGPNAKDIMVFVDEINARISGHSVYDAFLGPLESGVYVRDGRTFTLKPAAWIFVGTAGPLDSSEHKASDKGSDFVSRLTLGQIDIEPSADADNEVAAVENVYLGAVLAKLQYPDVSRISKDVLELFRSVPPDNSLRDLRHFIERFTQVQYGQITMQNVPSDARAKIGVVTPLPRSSTSSYPPPLVEIESK